MSARVCVHACEGKRGTKRGIEYISGRKNRTSKIRNLLKEGLKKSLF